MKKRQQRKNIGKKLRKKSLAGNWATRAMGIIGMVRVVLGINKISELPDQMYLGKSDKLGFNIDRFIRGTQIEQQVFPEPFISTQQKDKLQHYFKIPNVQMEKCKITISEKPLEFVSICESNKVYVHIYKRDMTLNKNYAITIPQNGKDFISCDDIQIGEQFYYLVCIKLGQRQDNYNAHFYVLEKSTNSKNVNLVVVKEESFQGFLGRDNNRLDKVKLASSQISSSVRRNVIYQENLGINKEKTTKRIFIVDFDIKNKTTRVVAKKENAIIEETLNGGIINGEWFYMQRADKGLIYGCKISANDVNCIQNTGFSFGNSKMSIWKANFNYVNNKTVVFLASEEDFKSCIVNGFPIDKNQMACNQFKLDFTAEQKTNLKSSELAYSKNLNDIIISYFSESRRPLWISGYISVDVRQQSAQYTDLKQFQATSMSIVNTTYYTLQMGKIVSLHKRAKRKFTITPPKVKKSAQIYLSAYKNYYIDGIQNKENERIRGYVISSTLNKVESDTEQIDIYPISKFSTYNDDTYREFGYNSKQILGNNVRMNITLAGHIFPKREQFVREIEVLGDDLNDKDIKQLFLVGKGTFFYNSETDEDNINIMKCAVDEDVRDEKTPCLKYYKGKFPDIVVKKVALLQAGLFAIAMKPNGAKANMFLYRFVEDPVKKTYNFKQSEVQKIAEADSFCDLKMYGKVVFTICSNDGKDQGKPEIILNRFEFLPDGKVDKKETKSINPERLGNPNFKKGEIQFKSGSEQLAFAVNNNYQDLTLLEIDFDRVSDGLSMAIRNKHPIFSNIPMWSNKMDIQICQTISAVYFLEKISGNIYGANIDYIEDSFLKVPINGANRKINDLKCSPNREAFQVLVKDLRTEKKYLLTYYGFDGTQASKKLHSEQLIKQRTNKLVMTSILEDGEGVIYSYLYDESSMFYNHSLIVDLRGPATKLNLNDMVKGRYTFTVNLYNDKKSKDFTIEVDIDEPKILMFKKVEYRKYPKVPKKMIPLGEYLEWNGPLFDFDFTDSRERKWIKSLPRIRELPKDDIKLVDGRQKILGMIKGYYIKSDMTGNEATVALYLRNSSVLIGRKIVLSKYGSLCRNFILIKDDSYEQFFLSFICVKELRDTVNIIKIIKGSKNHDICNQAAKFEVQEAKVASNDKSVLIAVKEKGGHTITIYKASKDENRPKVSIVSLNWRLPGDMSLFSASLFDISSVAGVYILTVLSEGQNYIRAITLDFENSSIMKTSKIYGLKNSTYRFKTCQDDKKYRQLVCIVGGLGTKFEEIKIPVDKDKQELVFKRYKDAKTMEDIKEIESTKMKNILGYRLPQTSRLELEAIHTTEDYILLVGEFGELRLTYVNELGKEENNKLDDVKIRNKDGKKIDIISSDVKKRLPRQLNFLLYKRNSSDIYSIMEGDSRMFVAMEKEGNDTFIYYQKKGNRSLVKRSVIKDFEIEMDVSKALEHKNELKVQLIGFEVTNTRFYASLGSIRKFTVQKVSLIFVAVLVGLIFVYTVTMLIFKKNETVKRMKKSEVGLEMQQSFVGNDGNSDEDRDTGAIDVVL